MHPILFRLLHYGIHRIAAGNAHGLHSPFVFDLYTSCVTPKSRFDAFDLIEKRRTMLRQDSSVLTIQDFGAGAKNGAVYKKTVKEIASTSLCNQKSIEFIFNLIHKYQPKHIIELGTSLGLSSSAMALANPNAQIYTFEGATEIAQQAQKTYQYFDIKNCTLIVGSIDQHLPAVLSGIKKIDFAYLDANHRYQPTINYVEQILPYCHEESFILLDDIYWSDEMNRAWNELREKEIFGISIDFYDFGILFLRQKQPKQHFTLRF